MTQLTANQQLSSLITQRWSPRAFSDEKISEAQLIRLLDAARRAPSSFNIQPWHFIYATQQDEEGFQLLYDTLYDGNKIWAYKAPALMLSVTKTHMENGNPNYYARHDVGLAMGNLLAQATQDGLAVHQMGGYSAETAHQKLNIASGYEPVAMVAVGYRGTPDHLPENLQKVEYPESDPRQNLDAFVFKGKWGDTPDILK